MGLFESFIIVPEGKAGTVVTDRDYRGERESALLSRRDGWEYIRLAAEPLVPAAVAAVAEAGSPAIGAYVVDSDEAAIYCASPNGKTAWLAINPPYESEQAGLPDVPFESSEAAAFLESHDMQWRDPQLQKAAAEAIAQWGVQHAPKAASAEAIVEALARLVEVDPDEDEQRIPFAEDGLRAILTDLMGFAPLDDAVFMVEAGYVDL